MREFTEFLLADGTPIGLEVTSTGRHLSLPRTLANGEEDDLPEGMGVAVPVSRGTDAVARAAIGTLRTALRPLGSLLQEVHDAVATGAGAPAELTVEFGVQLGQDLRIAIVDITGSASLKVTATWRPGTAATSQDTVPVPARGPNAD